MSNELATTGAHSELATVADVRASAPEDDIALGTPLGRYTLVAQLGEGAMGSVFAAHDPILDREVALKVLRPGRRDARGSERLQREARALARISHPNVVTINDVGRSGELVYLAMELVDGQTLAAWLDSAPRDWPQIVEVMVQAGQGLGAVHDAGLVHRDFKPDNVMIASDGRVLLADFGIALAESENLTLEATQPDVSDLLKSMSMSMSQEVPRMTRTGALLGTPRYMAPEQFLKLDADRRTDQWAFCAVLWEALFDQHPFAGQTVAEIAMAVTTGSRQEPPRDHPVPPVIVDAMIKGLSVTTSERHASMDELLRLLEPRRIGRRRWTMTAAAGVAAVAVVGIASVLWTRDDVTPCDGPARMVDVWNEQRASAVKGAFDSVSLPLGAATQGLVIERLDEYRDQWIDAYVQACAVEGQGEPEQHARLDQRFACLNERREAMGQLVAVLESADETVVVNAASAVLQLPHVDECQQGGQHEGALPLPSDPALRREVEQVAGVIAEVKALAAAGRISDAYQTAQGAHAQALDIDYPPLHAMAGLTLGVAKGNEGVEDRGQQLLEEAVELALSEGMDEVAAKGAVVLAGLHIGRNDADEARRWLRHAQASSDRLGNPPLLELDLLVERASLCHYAEQLDGRDGGGGSYERCWTLQQRVLEQTVEHYGRSSLDNALAHTRMGYIERKQGKYKEAIAHLEVAREITAGMLGPAHPEVARIFASIQEVYRAQGDYARAHAVDEIVLPILEAAYGPDHAEVVNMLERRATLLASEGKLAEALDYYDQVVARIERATGPDHPRVAMTLGNRSVALGSLGRHEEAIADLRRALRITEQVYEPTHTSVAILLDNLGFALVEAGRPEEALPLHERALPIWESRAPGSPSMAISLTDHARALLMADRAAEAVPLLERAVVIFSAHTVDPAEGARARFVLAKALVAAGRDEDRARSLAQQARQAYAESSERQGEVAAIDTWLAEHADSVRRTRENRP